MIISDYDEVAAWVSKFTDCDIPRIGAAIGWTRDDELTCGVLYEHFTGRSITATIAVASGAVMPKIFLAMIFQYPFEQLGVEKIICFIEETNLKSIRLVEHMGFTKEAEVTDVFQGGSALIYTMRKADCRWLEMNCGQENQGS